MSTTLYYLAFQSFDLNTFDLNPKWGAGLDKYHMKNSQQTAQCLPTSGLIQRYCPGL